MQGRVKPLIVLLPVKHVIADGVYIGKIHARKSDGFGFATVLCAGFPEGQIAGDANHGTVTGQGAEPL